MKYQCNKWLINIYMNIWINSTYWYHSYRLLKRKNKALPHVKTTIILTKLLLLTIFLWNYKLQYNCVCNHFVYFVTLGNIVSKNCQRNQSRVIGIMFWHTMPFAGEHNPELQYSYFLHMIKKATYCIKILLFNQQYTVYDCMSLTRKENLHFLLFFISSSF